MNSTKSCVSELNAPEQMKKRGNKVPVTKEFLMARVKEDSNGCWIWQKSVSSSGYGAIGINYRVLNAHRVFFEFFTGPIPAGMLACHKCDVRRCCNPAHLFLGTDIDNQRDSVAKGRHKHCTFSRANHPLSKISVAKAIEIAASALGCQRLSRIYGVSTTTIKKIRRHAKVD